MTVKSFDEMAARMRKASAGDVFLLSGEEFFQSSRLQEILNGRAGELGFETLRLTPDDMGEVNLRSVFSEASLFSPGKLVILNQVDKLQQSDRKDLQLVLGTGFQHILLARTAGRKPSNAFMTSIARASTEFTCWEPFPGSMWVWTRRLAEEEGISFTRDGGQAVEAMASGRLERLRDTIARVALFHGRGKKAGAEDVFAAVKGVRETNPFQFCEHALAGRRREAMVSLSTLLDSGEEPIRLLALVYGQWKQVAAASEMLKKGIPPKEASRQLGIPGFRWKKIEQLAAAGSVNATYSTLESFAAADHGLKTGGDPLVSIASVVLTLTIGR